MRKMKKIYYFLAGLGTLLIAAAQIGPTDAISNLSGWADYLGFSDVSKWLKTESADMWGEIIGTIVLVISITFIFKSRLPWRITWDFSGNFISLSSQRQSIGKSGDMMLYGDVEYRINQF
jgi:hypothetical protein